MCALNNISVAVEEMAVEAALTGDEITFQSVMYDPLTTSVLSLRD